VDISPPSVEKPPAGAALSFTARHARLEVCWDRGLCGRDGDGVSIRRSFQRRVAACRGLRLGLVLCGCLLAPAVAHAEFQIEGSVAELRVEATQTPIEELFSALSAIYGVTISATVLPDQLSPASTRVRCSASSRNCSIATTTCSRFRRSE